jgi:von Willebrand factor type A domain
MANRGLLPAAAALAACAMVWPGALGAQAIQRAMYVSVVNEAGAPVPDLGPTDFVIREDNVEREVLRVVPAVDPMQIALLVDNSQAARDDISHMRTALPPFIAALTGGEGKNQVAIIAIGERPTVFTDYSSSPAALKKGVDRIWAMPDSGAYLLDAIVEVCQGIKKREATRPVIVSITTEGPELSNLQHEQVLEPLRASGAAYHAITMGRPSSSLSDEVRNRNIVFDQGPRTTGGSRDPLLTSMALGERLMLLANQLMHQYKVTYARPQSLIPPERVTVTSAKPGLTARGTLIKEEQVRP